MIPNSTSYPLLRVGEMKYLNGNLHFLLDSPETVAIIRPIIEVISFTDGAEIDKNQNV